MAAEATCAPEADLPVTTIRLILGDQLSPGLSSLCDIDKDTDVVLMAEVMAECTYVKHHKKKIAFVLSAMRHFADELAAQGIQIDYIKLKDRDNTGTLKGEAERAIKRHKADKLIVTRPGEYRLQEDMESWSQDLGIDVEFRDDDRFIATLAEFNDWAQDRKELRMEYFYREMRRKTGFLMTDDGEPDGGKWNYDKDNRKSLPDKIDFPGPSQFTPDDITEEVLDLVEAEFADHFGDARPFSFAVKRHQAEHALKRFIDHALPCFGDYQDAMTDRDPHLFHSILAAYINVGLLDPHAVCAAAEKAYEAGNAPLNAVEGFIRQIIGWREFVRGVYWHEMPDYKTRNILRADRPLPDFFWTGDTRMACMAQAIGQTKQHAYAHHIQRLMVTGNFALLAGLDTDEVNDWYMCVYADAYEWVELPNTHGMALWADGGILGSKPYAASGKYIERMSDHCKGCAYNVKEQATEDACPFNALYWDFIARHEQRFDGNHRMGLVLNSLRKMNGDKLTALRKRAANLLEDLDSL
jgi:deoxyribodipyrimidine photolyase-related protein